MTASKKSGNSGAPPGSTVSSTNSAINAEMLKALTYCGVFLGSGICNTLIVQLIYDTAKFDSRAMLTNTFIFMGYAMMRFLPAPTKGTVKLRPGSAVPSKVYIVLAVLDAFASLLTTVGQISIGSGLFQVIFSSKIIFSALLSKFWLRRSLTPAKWASIFVIVFGLIICVYKPSSGSSSVVPNTVNTLPTVDSTTSTVDALDAATKQQQLTTTNNSSFFAEYGTVTMGVLYALQSIVVFFSSAMFLCDPTHPTRSGQCLTTSKLLGSMIVITGGLLYTFSSAAASNTPTPASNTNNTNSTQNTNFIPPSPSKTLLIKTPTN
ncbi:hypothetical protein PPL_05963 [Heterostelium album PN500]|uniref:UDP-galactose transporter n=1 Tax=Heterostelium pallidum (strain ATCC 26659 / Pp 5 / PN500) TaxID=670386 RepID=D3BBU4_HETP5|nr:hypothetical protein PPL_05963 [Heterostelium album PN500]EFA81127.1 hypothetical protein PPL_05963 [Heterostelium album PN500]|eukprot:XP_020433245.1 hypothetical protein PPL_05963 [Heterostelium album PN500]